MPERKKPQKDRKLVHMRGEDEDTVMDAETLTSFKPRRFDSSFYEQGPEERQFVRDKIAELLGPQVGRFGDIKLPAETKRRRPSK